MRVKYAIYVLTESNKKSEAIKHDIFEATSAEDVEEVVKDWVKRGYELVEREKSMDWGHKLYFMDTKKVSNNNKKK